MKELLKDIIETSRDRIKTPITGSFITAFTIYNWRPLLYLIFSNATIEKKIEHINATYCDFWAIVIPLFIAFVYIGLVPYVMVLVEYCTKKAIEGRKTHKNTQILFDLNIEKHIASEEFQIEKIKTGHKEIAELNRTIDTLSSQIDTINNQNKISNDNYESLIENSNANEGKLQNIISDLNNDNLSIKAKFSRFITLSGLEDLIIMKKDEKEYFLEYCDFTFFKKQSTHWYSDELTDKYLKLELIAEITKKEYILLPLGSRFYEYLIEEKMDNPI